LDAHMTASGSVGNPIEKFLLPRAGPVGRKMT